MKTELFNEALHFGNGMESTQCLNVILSHYMVTDDTVRFLFDTIFTDRFRIEKYNESGLSVVGSDYLLILDCFDYGLNETTATYMGHKYKAELECYDNLISVIIEGETVALLSWLDISRRISK